MTEPKGDDGSVDTAMQELHRRGMAEGVRRDSFGGEGRTGLPSGRGMPGHGKGDGIAAEATTSGGGEDGITRFATPFPQPGRQHADGGRRQWSAPLLATLAEAANVGSRPELHVPTGESGELGDPQTGLHRDDEKGVVSTANPTSAVWSRDEGLDLGRNKELHVRSIGTLGGDCEHPLDEPSVLRMAEGGVAEQRVHSSKAGVAGRYAVPPGPLEMGQECPDERRVEIGDIEGRGCLSCSLLGEGKKSRKASR